MVNPNKFCSLEQRVDILIRCKELLTSDAVFEPMQGKRTLGSCYRQASFLEVDLESQSE